jgi:hypothetical protein
MWQIGPDGKWKVRGGKYVIANPGTPCCCGACNCPQGTPQSWTASLIDVIAAMDCVQSPNGAIFAKMFGPSVINTTALLQPFGPFIWRAIISPNYTTYRAGAGTTCTNFGPSTDSLLMVLGCSTQQSWTFSATLCRAQGPPLPLYEHTRIFQATAAFDCQGGTRANDLTAFSCPNTFTGTLPNVAVLGISGFAVLTPNF